MQYEFRQNILVSPAWKVPGLHRQPCSSALTSRLCEGARIGEADVVPVTHLDGLRLVVHVGRI